MKKGTVIFIIVSLVGLVFHGSAAGGIDPYLRKAFSELKKSPAPAPTKDQQEAIDRIIRDIKHAARQRRHYVIDQETAQIVGPSGITDISHLLRHRHAWVRGMATEAIALLDKRRSVPFLIGLLTDRGSYDWMNDVTGHTVSRTAESELVQIVGIDYWVPVDEIGKPLAREKAKQRWITYHLRYCVWQNDHYLFNPLALYSNLEADRLAKLLAEQPERFEQLLVVYPSVDEKEAVYTQEEPVRICLIFKNLGTKEICWIRWDKQDRVVHNLRMIGPNNREVPIQHGSIKPLQKNGHIVQPIWRDGSYMCWEMDLHDIYDLSRKGRYRLYYSYVPPKSPPPWYANGELVKQISTRVDIRFWDGRRYVDYFEFLIK